ncbi:MAG: CdaR family protein [Butyrivibrio sp.]|nr:CdaR family protein [Butyrivibrio sp.]
MKFFKDIKIKDLIFKNFALKILAVIIAVVLWIVIVNVDNPSQRKTISGITVNLLNGDVLTDMDYIYQVNSGSVISIVVKAPQTIVEELKASDFTAYADLTERAADSDKVPIHVSCTKEDIENQVDIISLRTEYVQLSIDNKVDRDFDLIVDISGNPAENYIVGGNSISPTTIKVSGAESIVSRIESAVLRYNVDGMTDNIDDAVVPVFLDANGSEVSTEKLNVSRKTIRLKIDIFPTKWVPVNFAVSGEPEEGYVMTGSEPSLESVKIAAPKELLEALPAIDIPAGTIDITGLKEDTTLSAALSAYLPSGYSIVSEEQTLSVAVRFERIVTAGISVPIRDISIAGMNGAEYEYEITSGGQNAVAVEITGRESVIGRITAGDLKLSADLSGRGAGRYRIPISIADDDRYTAASDYYLDVLVRKIIEETTPEETTSEEDEGETVNAQPQTTEAETPSESAQSDTE